MAKASQNLKVVQDGINLHLTQEEAEALLHLTQRIGGCPDLSPRKHFDSIRASLVSAEVELKYMSVGGYIQYEVTPNV